MAEKVCYTVVRFGQMVRYAIANRTLRFFWFIAGYAVGFVFVASFVTWFIIKKLFGIRVSEQEEYEGLDIHECGMNAYPEFMNAK